LSDNFLDESVEFTTRKKQALQLNITLEEDMTQEMIEEEIGIKLEVGMKNIKDLLDQMNI